MSFLTRWKNFFMTYTINLSLWRPRFFLICSNGISKLRILYYQNDDILTDMNYVMFHKLQQKFDKV